MRRSVFVVAAALSLLQTTHVRTMDMRTFSGLVTGAEVSALKREFPPLRFLVLNEFPYVPRVGVAAGIPDDVRALDGQNRSIRGFMLPLRFGSDGVSEFLLTASVDSCHFGIVPFITDWVRVEMTEGVPFPGTAPITVFGTFHVDVETDGDDVVGVYRMEGQAVAVHR